MNATFPRSETDPNALLKASNLSDVASASSSRTNLGLGTSATKDAGAASGVATLTAAQKVVESRADQAILPRELADLSRTGGWLPTGAISETFPRFFCMGGNLGLASGRLQLGGGIVIPGGRLVSTISVLQATTVVNPTNQWFCLVDRSANVLAKTADDTTTGWTTNTVKTLTISGGYTPTNAIEVFVGVVIVAATPGNLYRPGSAAGFAIGSGGFGDSSSTGLTNPASLGATAGNFPINGQHAFYAYIS